MHYLELAMQAVKEAENLGAGKAEAYILDSRSLSIEVANSAVETLKFANDTGIGLRVISTDGRVGFAFSSSIDAAHFPDIARQAIGNGQNTFTDRFNTFPSIKFTDPGMKLLDPKIAEISIEDKINLARRVEAEARRTDKRVRRSERCGYADAEYGIALANSNNVAINYRSGYCGLYGLVLAEADGDVQTGTGLDYTRDFDKLDPGKVGREAAVDAVLLLGAKNIGTTQAAVVLSPYVATNFFSVLIPSLSADAVQKGRSLFRDRIGQKVASPLISLVDDGRLDGGIASAPVDGEGMPTQKTELIADGVLNSYLYNSYTAAKDGAASTGNGVRHSFKSGPEIGPTNIFIRSGLTRREDLVRDVRDGFYVTSVMGMHTANPISGDFSVGAAGIWIRDGEFTQPVRGVAIAGNILDILAEIDAVGDDLRFFGSQGAPTIRISKITVSGT